MKIAKIYLILFFMSLALMFCIDSAISAQTEYVCLKHGLSTPKRKCPIDNEKLLPVEEWEAFCPQDRYTKKLTAGPADPGYCPVCGKPMSPSFTYYYCSIHPDKIFTKKIDKCPICKRDMQMRRVVLRYRCTECEINFVNGSAGSLCPICKDRVLYDRGSIEDKDPIP